MVNAERLTAEQVPGPQSNVQAPESEAIHSRSSPSVCSQTPQFHVKAVDEEVRLTRWVADRMNREHFALYLSLPGRTRCFDRLFCPGDDEDSEFEIWFWISDSKTSSRTCSTRSSSTRVRPRVWRRPMGSRARWSNNWTLVERTPTGKSGERRKLYASGSASDP